MDEMEFVENSCCPMPPLEGCTRIAVQDFEISMPVEVKPQLSLGRIETECLGLPVVKCDEKCGGNAAILSVTQKIRVKIPFKCDIIARGDDSTICCKSCPHEEED